MRPGPWNYFCIVVTRNLSRNGVRGDGSASDSPRLLEWDGFAERAAKCRASAASWQNNYECGVMCRSASRNIISKFSSRW